MFDESGHVPCVVVFVIPSLGRSWRCICQLEAVVFMMMPLDLECAILRPCAHRTNLFYFRLSSIWVKRMALEGFTMQGLRGEEGILLQHLSPIRPIMAHSHHIHLYKSHETAFAASRWNGL